MTRSKTLLAGLAAVAAVGGLAAVPSAASAQNYGYPNGYYDPCRRDTTQRSTTGGLTGAAIGAAIGSGMASRGVRTEGAVLGGLLGAAIGAKVGHDTAACAPGAYPQPQPQPYAYENRSPYQDYGYGSAYGYPAQPYQGAYNNGYDDSYNQGYGYRVNESVSADGCSLAESPIYLPDGQVQKRFVRVCRDRSGRYQVVD